MVAAALVAKPPQKKNEELRSTFRSLARYLTGGSGKTSAPSAIPYGSTLTLWTVRICLFFWGEGTQLAVKGSFLGRKPNMLGESPIPNLFCRHTLFYKPRIGVLVPFTTSKEAFLLRHVPIFSKRKTPEFSCPVLLTARTSWCHC